MDAFAVAVCKGLSVKALRPRHALLAGLWFGGFQFLMPVIGWLLGVRFESLIQSVDHWIAFGLLVIIGLSMIRESRGKAEELNDDFGFKTMLLLAVATSIDAFAVGITFAFLGVEIVPAVLIIGLITFLLSAVGVKIGNVFGEKFKAKAEILGGVVLILMGTKILLEHLGLLG
jgi:putative Mn2+ efflux pump MntP